jgi:hypothetical protein
MISAIPMRQRRIVRALVQWVSGLPGCWIAVMFITLSVLRRPVAGRAARGPGLRPIVPAHPYLPVERRLRGGQQTINPLVI